MVLRGLVSVCFMLVIASCGQKNDPDRPAGLESGEGGAQAVPGTLVAASGDPSNPSDEEEDDDDSTGATGGSMNSAGLGWQDTCGDGGIDPGEACDDGNQEVGDGCDATCCVELSNTCCRNADCYASARRPCHCGDGVVDFNEECDDGNLEWGDGCSGYCADESGLCGNGVADIGEQCGRVAPGDCSPRAPTDPDVRNSRIRLLRAEVRGRLQRPFMLGTGKGWLLRSAA